MKNPDPIKRAWRLEKRRKDLGSDNPRCFYCRETDLACLEVDHPVTEELDPEFRRVECRNHHRKLELKRDLAGLTKNGRRGVKESKRQQHRRYLLLLAEDQDSITDLLMSSEVSPQLIAEALQAVSASLRRKADSL
jgi:hypothetical protein